MMAEESVGREPEPFRIDPATTIGPVTLGVLDPDRMGQFYRQIIGLTLSDQTTQRVDLGIDETILLRLEARPNGRQYPRRAGLFHLAIRLPSRSNLGHWLNHLATTRYPLDGAGDHLVSEALYLTDPEGNGIELYWDRPRHTWQQDEHGIKMATLAVDLASLQAESPVGTFAGLPVGTTIGHIHLKVDDVEQGVAFYRDVLGFDLTASLPSAGFLSAGGYHHHIGLNMWQSRGASPLPAGALGLVNYMVVLPAEEAKSAILNNLTRLGYPFEKSGPDLMVRDPAGNGIVFAVA